MADPGQPASPENIRDQSQNAGFWTPRPDPTVLTTEAVARATEVFRRELLFLRETIETRLTANDEDRDQIRERLRDLPGLYETFTSHLRDELIQRDAQIREVLEQRLTDMDTVWNRAIESYSRVAGAEREFVMSQIRGLRAELEQRIGGMDQATKLLADNVDVIPANIEKSARSLKEIIETRLAGMDEATKLLATNVDKVPYAILQEAGNLKAFIMSRIDDVSHANDEKFNAVEEKFSSNALALTAALAAQEKAVAEQNRSNTLAISKSESSTKETIAANAAQAQTANASLAAQVVDIKERVVRIESTGAGATASRTEIRATRGEMNQTLVAVIMAISVLVAIASIIAYVTKKLHTVTRESPAG